jgi:hypothetical protein
MGPSLAWICNCEAKTHVNCGLDARRSGHCRCSAGVGARGKRKSGSPRLRCTACARLPPIAHTEKYLACQTHNAHICDNRLRRARQRGTVQPEFFKLSTMLTPSRRCHARPRALRTPQQHHKSKPIRRAIRALDQRQTLRAATTRRTPHDGTNSSETRGKTPAGLRAHPVFVGFPRDLEFSSSRLGARQLSAHCALVRQPHLGIK